MSAQKEEPEAGPGARLLVVDDEESMRYYLERSLRRRGFEVEAVERGEEAIQRYEARPFDVAVVDLKMPGTDGIEVLTRVRAGDPEASVILMTAYGTIKSAVEAMKLGAFHYITKPFEIEELLLLIDRALGQRATLRENRELRQIVDHRSVYGALIGQSEAMRRVYQTIDLLRESSATVLITGESGTGKELVARAVHFHSRHTRGEFVPLNCAALADNLLESELFGHEAGAFTGAVERKRGLIQRADGGTLFLDEISAIAPKSQAKLVRFLQEKEFTPVGGAVPVRVALRIIAASNQNLEKAVEEDRFRKDLFWRLNVVPVHLPPLRDRREDIPLLASHFLERYGKSQKHAPEEITLDAMIALCNYSWPGNVRELQNAVERMVVLHADEEKLDVCHIPAEILGSARDFGSEADSKKGMAYQDALRAFERHYLMNLFEQVKGNVSKAAILAGMSRQGLHNKVKHLGLDLDRFRA